MADYTDIYGKRVKVFDPEPTLNSSYEGQVWYDSTTGTLKSAVAIEAFTSGSNLSTGRFSSAGAGSQTASLIAGGYSTAGTDLTEEYNGSGWSTGGTLNQARYYIGGAGTQTSALAMSGRNPPAGWALANTEEYNGTAWTNTTASPTALNQVTTTGTQTAALLWGGVASPGGSKQTTTFELNSESWTAGGALPVGLKVAGAFGTQTAAMSAGNGDGSTLYYNGSTWSDQSATVPYSGSDYWNYGGTSGTQTAGILMGGGPGAVTTTAKWDGSTWSSNPAMAVARLTGPMGPIGTSTAGLIASGNAPGPVYTTATEEFNSSINTFTAAAWSSGGNLSTIGRYSGANAGTKNAALYAGGYAHPVPSPSYPNSTEEYNGSSWSSGGNLSNLGQGTGSAGLQTACWATGRSPNSSPTGPTVTTEEYDGSSWSGGGNLNTSQGGTSGCGTLTAGSYARGGQDHENYNGTAWTAATDSPSPQRGGAKQAGTQTANIFFGGEIPGGTYINTTLEWDGSSWTTGGNLLINSAGYGGGIGTQTAAMQAQGWSPATSPNRMTQVSAYDGSSWSTRPSLSTGRSDGGNSSASPNTDAITFSGAVPPVTTATEEFTGATETATASTLTTS